MYYSTLCCLFIVFYDDTLFEFHIHHHKKQIEHGSYIIDYLSLSNIYQIDVFY